jgi:hypothetical protein
MNSIAVTSEGNEVSHIGFIGGFQKMQEDLVGNGLTLVELVVKTLPTNRSVTFAAQ